MRKQTELQKVIQRKYMVLTLMLTGVSLAVIALFHMVGQIGLSSFLEKTMLSQVSGILGYHNEYSMEMQENQNSFLLSFLRKTSQIRETSRDISFEELLHRGIETFPPEVFMSLAGKDLHLYRVSPEGVITESTFPQDLGLDLSRYPRFWKRLLSLGAGKTVVAEPIPSTAEARLTRYAYLKQKDGSFLEASLSAEDCLMTEALGILKTLPLVRHVALYHYPTLLPGSEGTPPLENTQTAFIQPLLEREEGFLPLRKDFLTREIFFLWKNSDIPAQGDRHFTGMWIVHLHLDVLWIQKLFHIALATLSGALLLAGTLFSLRGKKLALAIKKPVEDLLFRMQLLSEHAEHANLKEMFLKEKPFSEILEVQQLSQGFDTMALQVRDAFLKQERALRGEHDVTQRLNKVLESTLELTEVIASKSGTLFSTALKNAISLVPEAEYGAITQIEEGICHFRAIHSSSGYAPLDRVILFPHSRDGGASFGTLRKRHYADTLPSSLNAEIRTKIFDAIPSSRETLVKPLFFGTQCAGELILSIPEGSRHSEFSQESLYITEALGNGLAAFLGLDSFIKSQELFQKELLMTITGILETHDAYTQGHSESVAFLGGRIARALNLPEKDVQKTYWAGLVHDIGKILIPKEILNKPSSLSPEEYAVIQEHPALGYTMLTKAERLEGIAPFVLHHHERWDGRGYPNCLQGNDIPLISRILSVADAWDAMTSSRSYRQALSEDIARREILLGRETQFDPQVVDAFFSIQKNPPEMR